MQRIAKGSTYLQQQVTVAIRQLSSEVAVASKVLNVNLERVQTFNEELRPSEDLVIAATLGRQMAHALVTDPLNDGKVSAVKQTSRGMGTNLIPTAAVQGLNDIGEVGVTSAIQLTRDSRLAARRARHTILRKAVTLEHSGGTGDLARAKAIVERREGSARHWGDDTRSHFGGGFGGKVRCSFLRRYF